MALTEKQRQTLLNSIREEAKELANAAFTTKDEAIQELFDTFDYERAELISILSEEWTKKIANEETWSEKTDVDRLFEAFTKLEERSVIALHNPHCTSPGAYVALDIEGSRRLNPDYNPIGGVTYCGASVRHALTNGVLPIFVVTHGNEPIKDTLFSKLVIKTLEDVGLTATFDKDEDVILIAMAWQKRTITEALPKFDFGDEDEDDDHDFIGGTLQVINFDDDDTAYVNAIVRGGFLTKDEIFAEIDENGDGDPEETKKLVEEAWSKKLEEEASWPETTDVDRLHQAFAAIEAKSILAFHNLGFTDSDAMYLAGDEWQRRGGEKSGIIGSVSYHRQALDGAIEDGRLYLGFDSYPGSTIYPTIETRMNAVGMIVTQTLQEHGLEASWNGDIDSKIEVKIDWKKRAIFEPLPKFDDTSDVSSSSSIPDLLFIAHTDNVQAEPDEDTQKPVIN